jgi:hypothetical protein
MLRFLVVVGCLIFAFQYWKTHKVSTTRHHTSVAQASPSGFQPVLMPDGAKDNVVLIFAALNCPHEEAQRADALAENLTRRGIPNRRTSSYSLKLGEKTDELQDAVKRTMEVMNGTIPAVFINGMAKSNPTLDEVVAEYERTK